MARGELLTFGPLVPEYHAQPATVRRNQMDRALAALMGAAHGPAVDAPEEVPLRDCDHLPGQRRAQAAHPANEACFELLWIKCGEHPPESVVKRDAL